MTTTSSPSSHASIVRGLIIAGVLLAVSSLLAALSPNHLSPELARRLLGVLMGAVVVIYANAVPKALTPLILTRCDPAAEQVMRRFTGWSLTLGGVAYAVVWMTAPIEHANALSGGLLCTALTVVIARLLLGMTREPRA